jgi:hypothetical protein
MGWSLASAVVCPYAFMLLCSDAVSPFPGYFAVIRAVSIADLDARKQFKADQVIRTASRSSAGPLKLLGTRVERHSTDPLNTSVVVPVQLVR